MRGLTDIQANIVGHVDAYRSSIVAAVARDCCPNKSVVAVERSIGRLVERQYLQLLGDPGSKYIRLGRQAISEFGFSSHRAKTPGPESLPRDLAIVQHCVFGQPKRERLSEPELLSIFSDFPARLSSLAWYIDESSERLMTILVLGTCSAEFMLQRVERGWQQFRSSTGPLPGLVAKGQVGFAILSQDSTRAHELEQNIPPNYPTPVELFVVPQSDGV